MEAGELRDVAGRVSAVETFGTVDGPGTRLVVFCQGCPMRCLYCHNPDTWEAVDADAPAEGAPHGQPGRRMTVGEVLDAFGRNRAFYRRGGITVSGGEPLMQPGFVAALFSAAHADAAGPIHTCLDTSGSAFDPERPGLVSAVLDACDLVLLDVKHADPAGHRALTGRDQGRVLAFGDELARRGVPVIVRHVAVPGLTDEEGELAGVGRIIARWPNVVGLDVLPYHTMGRAKYERLGIPYRLEGVPAMDPSRATELREVAVAARARALAEGVQRVDSRGAPAGPAARK